MKRRVLCWIVGLVGVLGGGSAHAASTWALLVGISKYQNPQISPLRFPAVDASGIQKALVEPKLGGLPARNVRLLVDDQATAANIMGAIDTFLLPNVKPGDQVILFLAGHGVAKGVGPSARGFLLPTDAKGLTKAALEASAVDLKALSNQLSRLPAAQFVLFVDACREDPTPGRGLKANPLTDVFSRGIQVVPQDTTRPASSVTFFACELGQRAFEDPTLSHGVFTYWILDGIRAGAVEMGSLASYVHEKVQGWAKEASKSGEFEIEQTPVMVATELQGPVILIRTPQKRPAAGSSAARSPAKLRLVTLPEGATVAVNGKAAGASPVTETVKTGPSIIKVEAPGYRATERTVNALDGYLVEAIVTLEPTARGGTTESGGKAGELLQRAMDAEKRQQWEVAEAGYSAALQADPKLSVAYERLADLHLRQGRPREAVAQLLAMIAQVPPDAHSYSLLSRAYAVIAEKGVEGGEEASPKSDRNRKKGEAATFSLPRGKQDAGAMARRAADAAIQADPNSAEAQLALGFSLVATDNKGSSKRDALAAFGKAILIDPQNAGAHFGLGYGIRVFAQAAKDEAARKAELARAVTTLKEALRLRPDYYEAHRELAFCYHLMDDTKAARREYQLANANRGAATDKDEVAGVNLALSGLYQQEAQKSDGDKKQQYSAASSGYLDDAKEITPDLKQALSVLAAAGLRSRLTDFLPAEMRQVLTDLEQIRRGRVQEQIRRRIRFPGLPLAP